MIDTVDRPTLFIPKEINVGPNGIQWEILCNGVNIIGRCHLLSDLFAIPILGLILFEFHLTA